MSHDKESYVSIADDCGWTVALVGPFPDQEAAQTWADKEEAKSGHVCCNEPYCVLQLDKPSDYEL
jgi:hypothetical protein